MDTTPAPAPLPNGSTAILVATASRDDADGLRTAIGDGFGPIAASFDPDEVAADFDRYQPRVLVLGFESAELAEQYYRTLQLRSRHFHVTPHRSIVLCSKDELPTVFALCERAVFDDYVLYWPLAYDGLRLRMAVLQSVRLLAGTAAVAMQARITQQTEAAALVGEHAILVIDDDEMQFKLIRAQLRDQPYTLYWAPDAPAATQLLKSTPIDLILLDVELPGVAGPDLLRQLRREARTALVPVIMVSSHHSRPIVTAAVAAGANDYIVKPVDRAVLCQKLASALAGA